MIYWLAVILPSTKPKPYAPRVRNIQYCRRGGGMTAERCRIERAECIGLLFGGIDVKKNTGLAAEIEADILRDYKSLADITKCFSCGYAVVNRGRRFCSDRCRQWYDDGNPGYDQDWLPFDGEQLYFGIEFPTEVMAKALNESLRFGLLHDPSAIAPTICSYIAGKVAA
jgi:hypothetical protein